MEDALKALKENRAKRDKEIAEQLAAFRKLSPEEQEKVAKKDLERFSERRKKYSLENRITTMPYQKWWGEREKRENQE